MKSKLALHLPSHLQSWVEAQSVAHGYSNVSEYVQQVLMEKRQASAKDEIERRLLKAIDDNEFFDLTEAHFNSLDLKLEALAKSKPKKRHAIKR